VSRSALILAAHGSPPEPGENERIDRLARCAADRAGFEEGSAAFHQGDRRFSEVIDELEADEIVVVPFMTSDGYYADVVLPRELSRNRRFPFANLHRTPVVGRHPAISDIVADRAWKLMHRFALRREKTSLAVIGHGTPRHYASRDTTRDLANALIQRETAADVFTAFLDDDPPLESVVDLAAKDNVVVLPFLMHLGPHAMRDIPARIGLCTTDGTVTVSGRVGGRNVWCDEPVGADPRMIDLIVALATNARTQPSDEPAAIIAAGGKIA